MSEQPHITVCEDCKYQMGGIVVACERCGSSNLRPVRLRAPQDTPGYHPLRRRPIAQVPERRRW